MWLIPQEIMPNGAGYELFGAIQYGHKKTRPAEII